MMVIVHGGFLVHLQNGILSAAISPIGTFRLATVHRLEVTLVVRTPRNTDDGTLS
jgi:hypothetical protein